MKSIKVADSTVLNRVDVKAARIVEAWAERADKTQDDYNDAVAKLSRA